MKKTLLLFSLLSFACISSLMASPGDTIKVRSHNEVHMNWFGNFDRKAKFPDATKKFNKILLHYTLGCPSKGCSEWDYTAQVQLRKPTGKYDSTKKTTPNFKVDGAARALLRYNSFVTYSYFFNSTTKGIDSTANDTLKIDLYNDSLTPLVKTASVLGWAGDYYKPVYDLAGVKTDSTYIGFETELTRKEWSYYTVFEVYDNFELGRIITPYNGNVANTWKYTYTFDITDYASLLRDSVEIRAHYSGYQDGFTVTLDFDMIEGTPARECYKIVPLWNGSSAYGAATTIENFLISRDVAIDADMKEAKIRIIQTGHGFGGSDGCSEFCQKKHYLKINNDTKFEKTIWRENCGENPVFPQGGTWVYNRSNWCPGAEVDPYDYEVGKFLAANSTATIDLDMEPYTNQGNNNSSYIISGALFLYKNNVYKDEASLEEVMAPNNTLRYARFNPVCDYPMVKVRNNGSENIKSIEFSFGPKGGTRNTYTWNGDLKPYEYAEITMGTNINFSVATPTNAFEMEIVKVNGKTDEVNFNNLMKTTYDATPVLPNQFVVWLRTNNRANENTYTITDHYGNVVYKKENMVNATLYQDTIDLINGCYTFKITDAGGDGIGFWANPNAGNGQLYFRRLGNGQLIKNFGTDWGTSIVESFTTGYTLGVPEVVTTNNITLFPNPTKGEFWLDINLGQSPTATVQVMDYNGRVILNETVTQDQFYAHRIDMAGFANGVYILKVASPQGGVFTQKLIKTE